MKNTKTDITFTQIRQPQKAYNLVVHIHKNISVTCTHNHTHTRTHTHNQTSKTFKQISSFWVPLRGLFQLEFPGPHKPDQGGESGTPPSSWTLVVLLLEKLRVSWLLERLWIGSTFYRICLLAEYMLIKQWLITRSWWPKGDPLISWLAAEHFGTLCFLYNPCVISST